MEISGSEASSIIDFASDAEMPEDPVEEPVYLGRKREKFYKVILERGEGIDKPGTIDEVVLRHCEFTEILSDKPFTTYHLGKGELPDYIEKGVTSMKVNEVADLHIPEHMTKSESIIIKIELKSFINIHDLHANGMLFKKVLKKSSAIDRINHKDEVKIKLTVLQGDEVLYENEGLEVIVGVSQVDEGLVEILKTMKLGEESETTVDFNYFLQKFHWKTTTNNPIKVRVEVIELEKLMDIYVNGGFFKKILQKGENIGTFPNSEVDIDYVIEYGTTKNEGNIVTFIDELNVPSLWEDALKLMKLGEYCKIECFKNEQSYHLRDSVNEALNVYDDTPVIYLRLNKILSGSPLYELEDDQKLSMALRLKSAGNRLFKVFRFEKAIEKYDNGLAAINPAKDNLPLFKEIYLALQLNIAASFNKLKDYRKAIIRCDRALEIENQDLKALYRKGLSQKLMNDFTEATETFTQGLNLAKSLNDEKSTVDFLKELSQIEGLVSTYHKKEKKIYANLFK